jgi:hypothetical protein
MVSQHRWVCTICGDGFTRRTSAVRHNGNLHSGSGFIVRPFEYLVGRQNGTFSKPVDPLIFRKNKNANYFRNNSAEYSAYSHEGYNNYHHVYRNSDNIRPNKIETQDTRPDIVSQVVQEQTNQARRQTGLSQADIDIERMPKINKLQELRRLLFLYYGPAEANTIFNMINLQVFNLGDESGLNYRLKLLFDIERSTIAKT